MPADPPTAFPHLPGVRFRIIFSLVVLGLFLILLYEVREILTPFVVSLILTYLLEPLVKGLAEVKAGKRQLGRGTAVLLVYLLVLMVLALAGYLVIPRLYTEIEHIAREAPRHVTHFQQERLPGWVRFIEDWAGRTGIPVDIRGVMNDTLVGVLDAAKGEALKMPSHLKDWIGAIFKAFTNLIVVFLLTAFLLIDLPQIKEGFARLVPRAYVGQARQLLMEINDDLSGVVRGQALICLINGILTSLALLILKIKYAVTIGLIAGLFSLIPIFGSIFSSVPAVLMGLTQSWLIALEVVGVIILIHLIEANFLNPKILGHEVELHPFIILFAIFAGERLLGVGGLLLGVPLAAIIRTVLVHVFEHYILPPALPPRAVQVAVDATPTEPIPPAANP